MKKKFIPLLILLGIPLFSQCQPHTEMSDPRYTVKKQDLMLYIQETGWIGSMAETSVRSPFDAPLVELVPEGTVVKKGELLGKLESSTQAQEEKAQRLAVQEAEVDTALTRHQSDIEKQSLKHQQKQARLQQSLEKLRLEQLKTERDQAELTRLTEGLNALEQRMSMLKLESDERNRLFQLGYLSQQERDQSALDLKLAEEEKTQLQAELKIAKAGPAAPVIARQQKQLQFATGQLQRLSKEAGINQRILKIKAQAATKKTDRLKKNLNYYQDMIKASQLISPATGTIVYGKLQIGQEQVAIKAGDSLKEGVEILKIVNLKTPMIRLSFHEIDAPRIAIGQRAEIRLDAYPERLFYGKISRLQPVARTEETSDLLEIRSVAGEITLEDGFPEDLLKPGMTCSVRVEVHKQAQVLSIPTQALHHEGDITYCWLFKNGAYIKQEVETGLSSIEQTEITKGLESGDQIRLTASTQTGQKAEAPNV